MAEVMHEASKLVMEEKAEGAEGQEENRGVSPAEGSCRSASTTIALITCYAPNTFPCLLMERKVLVLKNNPLILCFPKRDVTNLWPVTRS